eukprot:UN01686
MSCDFKNHKRSTFITHIHPSINIFLVVLKTTHIVIYLSHSLIIQVIPTHTYIHTTVQYHKSYNMVSFFPKYPPNPPPLPTSQ